MHPVCFITQYILWLQWNLNYRDVSAAPGSLLWSGLDWAAWGLVRSNGRVKPCHPAFSCVTGDGEQKHAELSKSRSWYLSVLVIHGLSLDARASQEEACVFHGKYRHLMSSSSTCPQRCYIDNKLLEESIGIISIVFSQGANKIPIGPFQHNRWHWVAVRPTSQGPCAMVPCSLAFVHCRRFSGPSPPFAGSSGPTSSQNHFGTYRLWLSKLCRAEVTVVGEYGPVNRQQLSSPARWERVSWNPPLASMTQARNSHPQNNQLF